MWVYYTSFFNNQMPQVAEIIPLCKTRTRLPHTANTMADSDQRSCDARSSAKMVLIYLTEYSRFSPRRTKEIYQITKSAVKFCRKCLFYHVSILSHLHLMPYLMINEPISKFEFGGNLTLQSSQLAKRSPQVFTHETAVGLLWNHTSWSSLTIWRNIQPLFCQFFNS